LGWYIHDDVLVITAIKPCAGVGIEATPVVYRMIKGGNPQQLSQEIQQQVSPESWGARTGNKIVAGMLPSVLIVVQKPLVHAELKRKFAGTLQAVTAPNRLVDEFKLLDQKGSISCQNLPLERVVRELSQNFNVPIVLDVAALASGTRVSPDTPFSIELSDVRLATALQLMLSSPELTFEATQGLIKVTSLDASEANLISVQHSVRSLMMPRGGNPLQRVDAQAVINLIALIAPSSWEQVGGPASIAMASPGNLRINHSTQVHLTILQLLADLKLTMR